SADNKAGVATFNWNPDIGTALSQTYNVGVVVGDYYARNSSQDNILVTVSKPLDRFVTGGGNLALGTSSGICAGDAGSRADFGFNVKYDGSGTNARGSVSTIIRSKGHVYEVKGSSFSYFSVSPSASGGTASIRSTVAIQDITNPLSPVLVDGSATLRLRMTDGTADQVSIGIWNTAGKLWFANKWNGSDPVKEMLGCGTVQ